MLAGVVEGHDLGEVHQPGLGGTIGGTAGDGDTAELGGDMDDAAASGSCDRGDGELAHEEGAGQADGDLAIPIRQGQRRDSAGVGWGGGIVYEAMESAEGS